MLMEAPSKLKPLSEDKKTLADLIQNARENYEQYYLLSEKYIEWQEWYKKQKKIFEEIK